MEYRLKKANNFNFFSVYRFYQTHKYKDSDIVSHSKALKSP
jgi:hypothetical protein